MDDFSTAVGVGDGAAVVASGDICDWVDGRPVAPIVMVIAVAEWNAPLNVESGGAITGVRG